MVRLLVYYTMGISPLNVPTIQTALQSGELQLQQFDQQNDAFRLVPTGQCQLVLPIRREQQVIGLLLLESNTIRNCSEEMLAFLMRLCDHAAIALANAQLYVALQSASTAKSEFVSFVSHELKTPMTSILGYTDMLLSRRFGDLNETQVKFLQTMRTNVHMMTSLVSDLTDISRIESGHLYLDYSAIALSEIVEAVVQSIYSQIEARSQTLRVYIPDNLPLIRGDRMRLIPDCH
jgi:Osmosensitive K+ channel histidine kinase